MIKQLHDTNYTNNIVFSNGSSRKSGDTSKLLFQVNHTTKLNTINLSDYNIAHYNYEQKYNDDYLTLITKLTYNFGTFVFVTPVYWYSMSGIMKVFFDRFTDLLDIHKTLGRKLRGKKMAVLTLSTGDNLGENFWLPFKATAEYRGMLYIGNMHTITGKPHTEELDMFLKKLQMQSK
jgi:multimeric flavodoxin WrbA